MQALLLPTLVASQESSHTRVSLSLSHTQTAKLRILRHCRSMKQISHWAHHRLQPGGESPNILAKQQRTCIKRGINLRKRTWTNRHLSQIATSPKDERRGSSMPATRASTQTYPTPKSNAQKQRVRKVRSFYIPKELLK